MANTHSPVQSILRLNIDPIPSSKLLKGCRVYHRGHTTVIVDDKGRIYSSAVEGRYFYAGYNTRLNMTLEILAKLKVISAEDWKTHRAAAEHYRRTQDLKHNAKHLVGVAKRLGIKLTKGQLVLVETVNNTDDGADK